MLPQDGDGGSAGAAQGQHTRETDAGILLGLQDLEQAVHEAGMLLDLERRGRASASSRTRHAVTVSGNGQQRNVTYLLQLKLRPAAVVGVRVQARGEQAPDGGRIHVGQHVATSSARRRRQTRTRRWADGAVMRSE